MSYIKLNNLSLSLPIYSQHGRSFKSSLINKALGGRIEKTENSRNVIKVLDNISLELKDGERLGVVGSNGSGKTTLLRVLTNVYKDYSGHLKVHGSIASLIDISLGMEPEATGFENIRIRGVMMGLKLNEIKKIENEIGVFSELGEYLNLPFKTYSTGMQMRLSFAISTSISADIIIMDEWLSVGDESFQIKAENRLRDLINKNAILILASHSKEMIKRTCNRVIRLQNGCVEEISINSL